MPSQKGFSPIIILIIVGAVAAVGFFLTKSGGLSLPGLGGVKTLNIASEKDFANIQDPILRKHFAAQANVAASRTKTKSSGKGEIIDIMENEFANDDFKFRHIQDKIGKEVAHLISIGDTTYVKDYSDGAWWKETLKPEKEKESEVPEKPEDIKTEFLKEDPSLFKSLGQEACGNLTCYKYEQTLKELAGAKRTFWFDTSQYLLRKEVSGFGEFTTEVEYSYDNINIRAPSPTKDVPEGKSVYDYFYPIETDGSAEQPTTPENFVVPQYTPPEE